MKIIIDKESIIKVFTIALYAVSGGDYSAVKDAVKELMEKIDYEPYEERPQGEWIPVSERLPNICGVYNVTKRVIDGSRCYYIADSCYFDGTRYWHNDNRINFGREYVNNIIAWQPLPEAYKEPEKIEVEEPITLTDEQITEMWESGYISDKEEEDA